MRNSEKIDRAFERAVNVIFYVVVVCVILAQIGYNPVAIFLSMSSIILAFAFMIGTASSKMFEGFLFILIRRPVSQKRRYLSLRIVYFSHHLFSVVTHVISMISAIVSMLAT